MTFDAEQLKNQIPYYLTAEPAQKELVRNLEALNQGATTGYYISSAREPDADAMLQGDGWPGFQLYSFSADKKHVIQGIVLSNSCDISRGNDRAIAPKIVFAPIVKLASIEARLKCHGLKSGAIAERIAAMKNQAITNIFYLPAGASLKEDYLVLLDDLHSMPAASHTHTEKLFTLSMAGFYLFTFKLSVHFCRLHENVDRRPDTVAV